MSTRQTIIILSMLGISSFAHSEVVPANKLNDVIQAIKDSISAKDLNCVDSVSGTSLKASKLNWDAVSSAELKINENQQPVIVLHNEADAGHYDTTVEVTTNEDYTIVEEITGIQYKDSTIVRKNVGTIVNPKYENIRVAGQILQKIECK